MKYKLLVLDVDGTLLNDKKEITPRTHAALLKAQQMGVHVVLASGRPTNGVQPLAEALELNHYGGFILSYNGGQIINAQTGELMFEKRIDPAMIPYLNRKAKENGFAQIRLGSGEVRMIPILCKATIGQVGNLDHENISLGKAGRKRWMGIRPTVRGVVMNPCDHPHGGGEGKSPVGMPAPVTPWGKVALGLKTRKHKKYSNKMIVKRAGK